jgi:acid phosphatase
MRIVLTLALLPALACAHATNPASSGPSATPPPAEAGCTAGHALVNATLWVQNSAEYRANALQAYAAARRALDAALADASWVGATEDAASEPAQPPAVILDLDETAIDNSAYEARMITRGITYDAASWNQWVSEAAANAVPGAAEFLAYAKSRGVTPFYVTNREARELAGTQRNLERLGFPLSADPQHPTLLLRGQRPEWAPSDKSPRRAWVASSYRVILLLGDDLNDFANARELSVAERDALVQKMADWWGTRWIIVPNPMYGSFERAVVRGAKTPCEELKKKIDALRDR